MDKKIRKELKTLLVAIMFCYLVVASSLITSFYYTLKFFGGDDKGSLIGGTALLLAIMLTIIFEGLKIVLNIYNKKNKILWGILIGIILVSSLFTINSFLNQMEIDKENSKIINPEWQQQQEKIKIAKGNVKKVELELDKRMKNKQETILSISSGSPTKKLEAEKQFEANIKIAKEELKESKDKVDQLVDQDIKQYVYSGKMTSNINTKLLDWTDLKEEKKQGIISSLIALMIEITVVLVTVVLRQIKKQYEIKKEELKRINNKIDKEAKKEEILKDESLSEIDKIKIVKTFNSTDKKKEILKKEILDLMNDNDGLFPGYVEVAKLKDITVGRIQRAMKSLMDEEKVYKEGRKILLNSNEDQNQDQEELINE